MEEILRPKPKFPCPPRLLICATEPDLAFLASRLGFPSRDQRLFLAKVLRKEKEGVALAGPVLGGPQMAILLENLIAAGAREILFFGWAGALRQGLPLGALLLPEEALSAEGTSGHYPSPRKPDEDLFWALYHHLLAFGLEINIGKIVSTDAIYRETLEFCQKFASQALAVEMECAAAFSVARFRQVKLAALLFVSDRVYPHREKAPAAAFKLMRQELLPFFRQWLGPEPF